MLGLKCLGALVALAHTVSAFQQGVQSFPLGSLPALCAAVQPRTNAFERRGRPGRSRIVATMQLSSNRVQLAGGLEVSTLGVGAWSWGDRLFWGYDDTQEVGAKEAFNMAVDLGVNLFDTAEVYGAGSEPNSWGYSEVLCGRFARDYKGPSQDEVLVATKFAPLPHRFFDGRKSVSKALRASLERLGTDRIDLYQLHWPGFFADAAFWDGLADGYEAGLVRSVGVSNYSAKRLRAVHKALADRGVPLATNQVQYSLIHRTPEEGVLQTCNELGVKILAYSPLAQGILTGRYSSSNLPTGPRASIFKDRVEDITPLLQAIEKIGNNHGKTPAQVSLNWLMCKGVIPIPGARTQEQARENCGAMGWKLSPAEEAELDQLSQSFAQFPGMPLETM